MHVMACNTNNVMRAGIPTSIKARWRRGLEWNRHLVETRPIDSCTRVLCHGLLHFAQTSCGGTVPGSECKNTRLTDRAGDSAGRLAAIVIMVTLTGCGGGGSGSSGGGTYTVGGAIKLAVANLLPGGLPEGLTLTDGTDRLAVAAAATQFSFPTALPSGHSYAVAVTQNPPGLVCTVSSGAGTVGGSNIDGIVVSCADAPYTVGGTVSGLTSAGLVRPTVCIQRRWQL